MLLYWSTLELLSILRVVFPFATCLDLTLCNWVVVLSGSGLRGSQQRQGAEVRPFISHFVAHQWGNIAVIGSIPGGRREKALAAMVATTHVSVPDGPWTPLGGRGLCPRIDLFYFFPDVEHLWYLASGATPSQYIGAVSSQANSVASVWLAKRVRVCACVCVWINVIYKN